MIKTINQDIFQCDTQAIIHQANCFGVMGGGFAKILREVYPEALQADLNTEKGCKEKLGTFSCIKTSDGKYIFNLYSQYKYGNDRRHTDYEAFYVGMKSVESHLKTLGITRAAVPYNIGCGKGGGSWKIVEAILEDIFESSSVELIICKI